MFPADTPTVVWPGMDTVNVTLLLRLKVPPHIVQAIVGHADVQVTMAVYAHASLDYKRKALDQLAEAVAG